MVVLSSVDEGDEGVKGWLRALDTKRMGGGEGKTRTFDRCSQETRLVLMKDSGR